MIRHRLEKLWPSFIRKLPASFVYHCGIRIWAETTTGVYGTTVVPKLTLSDGLQRFARIHGIPGHGKDLHFDSNRGRSK